MATKILYPSILMNWSPSSQFENLNNLRNDYNTYASSHVLNGDTPATIKAMELYNTIPEGSVINSVTVEWAGYTTSSVKLHNNITVEMTNIGTKSTSSSFSATESTLSVTFTDIPSGFHVESIVFALNFSHNKGGPGYLRLRYLRVIVDYTIPNFSVTANKLNGEYTGETFQVQVNCDNIAKTNTSTNVSIQLRTGVTYLGKDSGDGTVTIDGQILTWQPGLSDSKLNASVVLNLEVTTDGNHLISISESTSSHTTSIVLTTSVAPTPPSPGGEGDETNVILATIDENAPLTMTAESIRKGTRVDLVIHLPSGTYSSSAAVLDLEIYNPSGTSYDLDDFKFYIGDMELAHGGGSAGYSADGYKIDSLDCIIAYSLFTNNTLTLTIEPLKSRDYDYRPFVYSLTDGDYIQYNIFQAVVPLDSDLKNPVMTFFELGEEELNRLGHDCIYTAQSYIKRKGKNSYYSKATTTTLPTSSDTLAITKIDSIDNLPDEFTFDFEFKSSVINKSIALANEYSSTDMPGHYLAMGINSNSKFIFTDGTTTKTGGTLSSDTFYSIKLERTGNSFKCSVNNTAIGTITADWLDSYPSIFLSAISSKTGTCYVKNAEIYYGSGETKLSDWFKNCRIGVFNNPIEANITRYTQVTNDSDLFTYEFTIPPEYELTDKKAVFQVPCESRVIDRQVSASTYANLNGYSVTNLSSHAIQVTLKQYSDVENIPVYLYLIDSSRRILSSDTPVARYKIKFNAEETLPDEEVIEDSTDYNNLTRLQLIQNAKYWSTLLSKINSFESKTAEFAYDENYPVVIIITGEYTERNAANNEVQFTEPCIIESDVYTGRESNGNYPTPILGLVNDAEVVSELTVKSFEQSTGVIVYHPELDDEFGTNTEFAVRGIEIKGNMNFPDNCILFAKLKIRQDNQYKIGTRSVVIDSTENTITIGGKYDTWGLNISELINLENLELELTFDNILKEEDITLLLDNFTLTIYTNNIDRQAIDVIVEDEHVAWYGMYVKNIELPIGSNRETKYLTVEGTDTNIPKRQTIRPKTIKIYFEVEGCDLNETTTQLQQLAELFTNERDDLNNVVLKRIRFGHIPDKVFYYNLEDTFDTDITITDYKGSIELTIPDGTAFDIEDTVTNVNGHVEGIASVNPVIKLTYLTQNQITISETLNNPSQVFKINKDNLTDKTITFDTLDTIIINCINRTCLLMKNNSSEVINISEAVDFNSDWFKIHGEFEFTAENALIQTVTYNTRS